MQYKLTAEQIRNRAKEISRTAISNWQAAELDIVKFLEEATGEKIPEPFDESKVRHGSLWWGNLCGPTILLVEINGQWHPLDHQTGRRVSWRAVTHGDVLDILKTNKWKHVGSYDFAAGLPQAIKDL